eukprot:CAMPEP_0206535378 /NCGR_PEP_ID=MMETSP0325_2-20121206/6098_1 /ASSEMBLY_ACC=CAM_ASM_000347 /TAXON_ID=2866 /ORGANISM="Crypthecodinium cohnii, Strain Seligo" /LENGTH=445 /DNA_ID=CAMNT_0054032347 /DNA_START=84 /DNA_END=1418 /DNA_ORIENTATION=-
MVARHSSRLTQEITKDKVGFQGQRSGHRVALAEPAIQEEATDKLATKCISLGQLLAFCKRYSDNGKLSLEEHVTCQQVVVDVIKPETKDEQCCFMDIALGERRQPDCFVSHWMELSFRELVLAIVSFASGNISEKELLEKKAFGGSHLADDVREMSFWSCIFAVNWHVRTAIGHPLGSAEVLEGVLSRHKQLLLVVDQDLKTLSRCWCCYEVFKVDEASKLVGFRGSLAERYSAGHRFEDVFPGLARCQAKVTHDVDMLQKRLPEGVELADQRIKTLLHRGLYGLAWKSVLRPGRKVDLQALQTLLINGVDVDSEIARTGDTALHWAVQLSKTATARMLLQFKATPDKPNKAGWTPLHFAAQLGAEGALKALLAADVDPNVTSQNGRTPLIDAAEHGHGKLCELLLDAGASIEAQGNDGNRACSFYEALHSQELALRLGWQPKLN